MENSLKDNPCQKVRQTCQEWMQQNPDIVTINSFTLKDFASNILSQPAKTIEWDEEGWHYKPNPSLLTAELRRERLALSILVVDAINYCFWGNPHAHYEYEDVAKYIKEIAARDECSDQGGGTAIIDNSLYALEPQQLAQVTLSNVKDYCLPLPLMEERANCLKQLGQTLLTEFDGKAWNLIGRANGQAPALVQLIMDKFSYFRDITIHADGSSTYFLKRAQIVVADLNAALDLKLMGMDQLTTFADYRVPQILRHMGVLEYSDDLAQAVDQQQELERNGAKELSIRAATVVAVDRLVEALNDNKSSNQYSAVTVDWYLWQQGEKLEQQGAMKPHHRVRTICY